MSRHLVHGRYGLGWLPQLPDHRDHEFLPTVAAQRLPTSVALDVSKIPVLNQGQQGSCTGHGTAGVVMFDQQKQGEPVVVPSRAMIYYDARLPEGTTGQDSGAQVRDAVGGVVKYGVCSDSEFPYSDQVFDVAPSKQDYADATRQEALVYEAVRFPHLDQAIASGFPFVFGFTVYESFESEQVAATGVVPIPERGEQVLGGHCVWCWGYNSSYTATAHGIPPRTKACRNSWGAWGDGWDFYLPESYFSRGLASDFWTVRRIGPRS
ncbi:MAG: peptidase [Solirubrobacteraceae bacterium]